MAIFTMNQAAFLICILLGAVSLWYFQGVFFSRLKKPQPPALPSKVGRPFEKTYRVRGLPLTMTSTKLESILKHNYKLQDDDSHQGIKIGSLAEAPDGRTRVATVSFFQEPSILVNSHRDEFDFTETENELQNSRPYYLTIEDGFLGLTTLYCPKEDEHQVDIVAVSGLGGHAFGSFKERGGNYMWLRDSLPYDLKNARIFTYGYDSHLSRSESFQELDDLSITFRQDLQEISLNRKFPKPLILVAHSLGGLVVKGAIIQMHKDPKGDQIALRSICGILFIGVPNCGMDIDSLRPMVQGQPNTALLNSLERSTQLLRGQSSDFAEAFPFEDSKIVCFYETKTSPTAMKDPQTGAWKMGGPKKTLVDRDSATHGRSQKEQTHNVHPINRNHSDLVKFSHNDDDYRRVLTDLERIARRSEEFKMSTYRSTEEVALENKILSWLLPPNPKNNYRRARDARKADTGEWVFATEEFRKWESGGGLLWICGIPGAGKTIVSSTVINHIEKDSRLVMAYYFFDFNDDAKQTLRGILLSLLEQLSQARTRISKGLRSLYAECKGGLQPPDIASLKETIHSVLIEHYREGSKHIFIIIDALDECKEDAAVLSFINDLRKLHPHLHVYIASRPKHDIMLHMESFKASTINLSDINRSDIEIYVNKELENRLRLKMASQDIKDRIQQTLLDKSSGMFRWVVCQLDTLEKCQKRNDLIHALENLPRTLNETYHRALDGIEEGFKESALRIFQWLVFSKRPLTIIEAAEIFAIGSSPDSVFDIDERLTNPQYIISYLGTLVSIQRRHHGFYEEDELRLAHFSVQEYFLSDDCNWSFKSSECHKEIATTSLKYLFGLQDLELAQNTKIELVRPLAKYAANFWPEHYRTVDESEITYLDNQAVKLLEDRNMLRIWLFLRIGRLLPDGQELPSSLYYASYLGLCHLSKSLIQDGLDDHKFNSVYYDELLGSLGCPLQAASYKGHTEVVENFLQARADVNVVSGEFGTALISASTQEHIEIVELLIQAGADLNVVSSKYETALITATVRNHTEIVQLLIQAGADLNVASGRYGTALTAASYLGRIATAKLLIQAGADLNVFSGRYGTALISASVRNYTAIVELLVQAGADLNMVCSRCRTALVVASVRNHTTIVEFLIQVGADLNIVGSDYGTALMAASYLGRIAIAKLLIQAGADLNMVCSKHRSALITATVRNHIEMVELLIQAGADLNVVSRRYGTALITATVRNHTAIVELLIRAGADLNVVSGRYGTALITASVRGHTAIVELLIQVGADLNVVCGRYGTALISASTHGHITIVELLIQAGADIAIRDTSDKTVLVAAFASGSVDVVRVLIENGADINAESKKFVNSLQALFASKPSEKDLQKIVELLIVSGVNVNCSRYLGNQEYDSALGELVKWDEPSVKMVSLLLTSGVGIEKSGEAYRAAIVVAIKRKHSRIVNLLQRVQDFDERPHEGLDRAQEIKDIVDSISDSDGQLQIDQWFKTNAESN